MWSATATSVRGVLGRAAGARPIAAGLHTAQRWGRLSAGFVGGRAVGQVAGADERVCAILGAICGGAAAATSVAELPSSIGSFVALTILLESVAPSTSADDAGGPRRDARAEARAKARANYERRHRGDETRLRALSTS